jgi:hypothetical protein
MKGKISTVITKRVILTTHSHVVVVAASLFWFCSTAAAQTTGTIYGQIVGPQHQRQISRPRTLQQGWCGKQSAIPWDRTWLPSLPSGPYKLTVEHPGFTTYVQSGITVNVGENARVDTTLQVGAITQTVNVSGSALSVDTESTTVGATVDNLRVEAMPLNGRNLLALAQLLPGVGQTIFETQTTNTRSGPTVNVFRFPEP